MALTLDQAAQAGQIAASISQLNSGVAAIQAAISGNGTLIQIQAVVNLAGSPVNLNSNLPMSTSDSASILNAVMSVYQSNITALSNILQGM